jgi:hypothetical protein
MSIDHEYPPEERQIQQLNRIAEAIEEIAMYMAPLLGQLDLQKQDQMLGSPVPPGSDSALREGYRYIDRIWKVDNHESDPKVPDGILQATFRLSEPEYHALVNTFLPAGGLPTPDLADSQDSTPKYDHTQMQADARNIWENPEKQRIGVYDYPSLVSCLRENYKMLFPDGRFTDPQDMIQLMTAAIQALRSLPR